MKEFILVKGKSRNRLLRVDRIIDVEDTEEGAVINYRRFGEDSVFPLKTGSTAAEVLAAIEGAQDSAPILRGLNGGAWIQTSYNSICPIDPDRPMTMEEYDRRKTAEEQEEGEFPFACICVHPGDHSYCPVHGI